MKPHPFYLYLARLILSILLLPILLAFTPSMALAAPQKHSLSMVGPWEVSSLEPTRSGYLFQRMQVAETLVGTNLQGEAQPGLANWQISPDGLQWRFKIRPQARFHDGKAVTPADVVMNLKRALAQPGVLAMADISDISITASDEIMISLKQAYASLPMLLAHSSTIILAPASYDAQGRVHTLIGTGPYALVSKTLPQRLELGLSNYWVGKKPAISAIYYLSVSRPETRAVMAESQQADLVFGFDPASLQRLRNQQPKILQEVDLARTLTLKINSGHRWLKEPKVRQALSLAINRQGIAKGILRTPELAADQLLPPGIALWHQTNPEFPRLQYDVAQAQALLTSLGWQRGADGILQKDGERFRLKLTTFPDRPELPIVATALQDQWRKLGIEIQVVVTNSSEVPLAHRTDALELALLARSYALVPDPIVALGQDFKPGGSDWGAMHWDNPNVAELLQQLARSSDEASNKNYRLALMRELQLGLPVIPIAWYRLPVAVNPRLQGFRLDPLEQSYYFTDLHW